MFCQYHRVAALVIRVLHGVTFGSDLHFWGIAYYEEKRMFWGMQVALGLSCWVQSYDASVNQTKDLQRFCLIHTLRAAGTCQLDPIM